MVFSSLQAFLDPTNNWHHHLQQDCGDAGEISQLQLPPAPVIAGGGGTGAIRPTSMTERARLAKIPQPETALKCPRCESTNTKFCYFNNYSLSQPRHFCKTCRRYWTRGGALRNVPVGGGCRRNKRSKCNRSKSPAGGETQEGGASCGAIVDILGQLHHPHPPLPIFPPMHHFGDYTDLGMGCEVLRRPPPPSIDACHTAELQYGGERGGGMLTESWRMQPMHHQIPLLSGLEYSIDGGAMESSSYVGAETSQYRSKSFLDPILAQMGAVKMEDGHGSRDFLSAYGSDHQYNSVANTWSDMSGFASSTTATHIL